MIFVCIMTHLASVILSMFGTLPRRRCLRPSWELRMRDEECPSGRNCVTGIRLLVER